MSFKNLFLGGKNRHGPLHVGVLIGDSNLVSVEVRSEKAAADGPNVFQSSLYLEV